MDDNLKTKIKLTIKKIGLNSSIDLFGKDIINEVYDDHLEFMNNFKDLKLLFNSDGSIVIGVNENNEVMFRYRLKYCAVLFNYQEIWTYFSYIKELDFFTTGDKLKNWFFEFYDRPPDSYLDIDFYHDLQKYYYDFV